MENELVPESVKGWNWGAFMLNAVWGVGNKTYLPLLSLLPLFGLIWAVVVGIKGNEWAWKNSDFSNTPEDIRAFQLTQDSWNRAGLFAFILAIIVILFLSFCVLIGLISIASNYNVNV